MALIDDRPQPARIDYRDVVAEYLRIRERRLDLNMKLVKTLSRKTIEKGAKRLGMMIDGTLCLETEDESSVLMDFCIHDVRELGRNAVDRYVARPAIDANERALLARLKQAHFSLFQIREILPGLGLRTVDLLTKREAFIVDLNLSDTATPRLIIAMRIIPIGEAFMTTGAGLPFEENMIAEILDDLARSGISVGDGDLLTSRAQSEFTATVLRAGLARGASHRIRYE